jgi:cytochrome c553
MTRVLRALRVAGIVIAGLAVFAIIALYGGSEWLLRRRFDAELKTVAVPTDGAAIAEGRRLARIRGCNDGCHGKGTSGGEFFNEPWLGRVVAPDLARIAATQTDAELERAIRRGVRKDGRSTFIMPSNMFYHLSDADLGRIIAFLRSEPASNGPETEFDLGPLGRLMLVMNPDYAYASEIAREAPWATDAELGGEHGFGRYLALTVCSECHGMALSGSDDGSAPNLVAAGAYSRADFARLMKSGIAVGGRKLGLMTEVAQSRFAHLNDAEIRALYEFLYARAHDPRTYE